MAQNKDIVDSMSEQERYEYFICGWLNKSVPKDVMQMITLYLNLQIRSKKEIQTILDQWNTKKV